MIRWLNIGCGHFFREGWVNLDKFKEGRVDMLADLEQGLPFKDETFDYVYASHVLEHVHDVTGLIRDVHRVLKEGGIFEIYVPYGFTSSLFHVRYFFLDSMDGVVKFKVPLEFCGFEPKLLFKKMKQELTTFGIPGWWHLNHHFSIYIANLPLWKRKEIHWVLEKV